MCEQCNIDYRMEREEEEKDLYGTGNWTEEFEAANIPCCAVKWLSGLSNHTSLKAIKGLIEDMKKNRKGENVRLDRWSDSELDGESTIMAATMPDEKKLAAKLRKAGFKRLLTIPRRTSMGKGNLGIYAKVIR